MDSLVEIKRSKWEQLRDLYKSVWPAGAVAYCILDTHIANPTLSSYMDIKVYCPDGAISNGMIAVVDLFGYSYQLLIHPINDSRKIEEALQQTNVIDWNREVVVASASSVVIECIERIKHHLKIDIKYDSLRACKHLLDNDKPFYDLSGCPPNTYVGPLKPENVSLIDVTWTYHNETSHKFFELLMNNDMTYVLYSTKDDQPLSWVTVDTEGALTHLFTLEPYRRFGYAEYITKYAANDLRRKGRTVLVYTLENNEKPQRMFEKLNFDVIGFDQWIFINKLK